ncbi:MAG: SUMF1/EgtB/PvdO family nonheme iron enzyme [Phycisphaerales bacterium]|nr:MAG: SUMF1/EgtB/PvdO family nonheme iron enzyme [Phycisphaerales bacterium]
MYARTLRLLLGLATALVLSGASAPVWAGDVDGDGVDDAIDVCDNTVPGTAVDAEGRPLGDVDRDCDADLADYALFQQGFTGPLPMAIDTVPVGNRGNDGELSGAGAGGSGPDRVCGAVDYTYNIGKYQVTAGQYAAFLNAVAATDTYGLYNPDMWSEYHPCKIERSGSSGSYTYSVAADWADRPVAFVSWGDAARFANWLHNGQPTGAQDLTTTEDGSYYLNGAMSQAELLAITREPDATWVIPSEDEWYKAAYHYNDGVTGNYYDYPTSSDSVPSNDLVDPDPGNNATWHDAAGYTIGSPYWRTEVGAHEHSDSPYGTFDQGGNVWEWNEAILYGVYRGLRGGGFSSGDDALYAPCRSGNENPTYEHFTIGFRVSKVPLAVIDTVPVGNPGNDGELSGAGAGGYGPDRICGAVAYTYNIGKYEVTAGQYCKFLNAVANTDTYGLYNANMWSDAFGCKIERTGSSGSYTYSVAPDWADRPVNYASWGDAARFANWLHNGQPTGTLTGDPTQDAWLTEDGSYLLNGAMSDAELLAIARAADATWVIPSEDEWYKAAYHYNDGVTGNYWDYPTESDTAPTCEVPPGTDMTNGSANYYCSGWVIGSPYYRNEVGAYDAKPSDSPYGTFDQGGNVWEWNEAVIGSSRGVRGASFNDIDNYLRAASRNSVTPVDEHFTIGFRVAEALGMAIDTVPVGNPGNANDTHGDGYGGVAYVYDIGKYEVTAGQYCRFLNAVATTDTYGLYNGYMWSSDYGCKIEQTGSAGSYSYSVAPDREDRPVNYISWGDAARFANWLHNGQPTGAQDLTTTEEGSYYLNGAMSDGELLAITREPDATWVIPSEDEWYKAAYHYNDGATANYWDYPTASDTVPTSEAPPGTDMTNGSANYYDGGYVIGSPYWRTEVGAYDAKPSDSPYGTFDQGGNVWEWHEAILYGSSRGLRGGAFSYDDSTLSAAHLGWNYPTYEGDSVGLRVSQVP